MEAWKCLGNSEVDFLTGLFNLLLQVERITEEWRRSTLVPIYKIKQGLCPDVLKLSWDQTDESLNEYMGKSDISWLMFEVTIFKQQYGFMPGNCTTDNIFVLKVLAANFQEGQTITALGFYLC